MRSLTRFLFIFYCVEVGVYLLLAPWSPAWDRGFGALPIVDLWTVFLHPLFRGAVSGFGLVHIVWGAHDLELWLAQRAARRPAPSAGAAEPPVAAGSPGASPQTPSP